MGVLCRQRTLRTRRGARCSDSQEGALVQHGCLLGAFLFLRQPRIAGRRALLLLPVQNAHLPTEPGPKQRNTPPARPSTGLLQRMSPPPTRPARPTRLLHTSAPTATHHIGRHRCSCVSPAFSRAWPANSALPHANRLSNACSGFTTMTKQEGTRGPRPFH